MFAQLSLLALSLPLVSALTFNTPMDVVSDREATFSWTLNGEEPSLYGIILDGPAIQGIGFVDNTEQTNITTVVDVPVGDGYFLYAETLPLGDVFAVSDKFSIKAAE